MSLEKEKEKDSIEAVAKLRIINSEHEERVNQQQTHISYL